jgi:predicted GTPase
MTYGAGVVAAKRFGAAQMMDPRPYATGELAATLAKYPKLERLLPAMGYGEQQVHELEAALEVVPADVVLAATPIDITRVLTVSKPVVRVRYELEPVAGTVAEHLAPVIARAKEGLAGTR